MNYRIDISWNIGRFLQTNPLGSLGVGFIIYMLFMMSFGPDFTDTTALLSVGVVISIVVVPVIIAGTLGLYFWGLYYQFAIESEYGPKTLLELVVHIETKSDLVFDIEAVARSNKEYKQ